MNLPIPSGSLTVRAWKYNKYTMPKGKDHLLTVIFQGLCYWILYNRQRFRVKWRQFLTYISCMKGKTNNVCPPRKLKLTYPLPSKAFGSPWWFSSFPVLLGYVSSFLGGYLSKKICQSPHKLPPNQKNPRWWQLKSISGRKCSSQNFGGRKKSPKFWLPHMSIRIRSYRGYAQLSSALGSLGTGVEPHQVGRFGWNWMLVYPVFVQKLTIITV